MIKMLNYDTSSSYTNNLQRPSFNSSNLQTNDYKYKPSSPIASQSMTSVNNNNNNTSTANRLDSDKRFFHADNKYPSPRFTVQPANSKPVPANTNDLFSSDSKNFVTKSFRQSKQYSFSSEPKTSISENSNNNNNNNFNDIYKYTNYYQTTKEQAVKPISLSEKKSNHHHNHHNNHHKDSYDSNLINSDSVNTNNLNEGVVKVPKPKINKSYLIKMKRKYKNKISANLSGTKFDILKQVLEAMGAKILPDDNFER